jgi:hypothetical protein
MSSTLPNIPVHDGLQFAWSGNFGVAEVSSFTPSTLASRLYADACDVGFYVVSGRTGNRMLFSEERVERDAEGETVAWHYVNETGTIRITVFND